MNKTYACTDLHGMYNLWRQAQAYLDETDTLYFLGDACDRGDAGIKIIDELLSDQRVIYLKGNHEDMLDIVAPELIEGYFENYSWWLMNGGHETSLDFCKMAEGTQRQMLRKIRQLPKTAEYTNKKGQRIFMCHAGTRPDRSEKELQLMGIKNPYIWDRKHINAPWPQEEKYKDLYIIHGHTPVQILRPSAKAEPLVYANGHKIDLDLGSFDSCKLALWDLDEMKVEKIFFDEETCLKLVYKR